MKLLTPLVVLSLLASALPATAQINLVVSQLNNRPTENLVLGLTAYSSGTFVQSNCAWTSPTAPASLSAGGTMSGGPNNGTSGGPYSLSASGGANNMSNAASRATIRGKNNNGGTASTFIVACSSTNAVSVVIWGPTLNSFGITGATNFTWTCTAGNGYSNSGSGEASFTVPQANVSAGAVVILFTPSNDNELGNVMANFYN